MAHSEARKKYYSDRTKLLRKHSIKKLICARCWYSSKEVHLHHLQEVLRGGSNEPSNLVPLCSRCHREWEIYEGHKFEFEDFLHTPSAVGFAAAIKSITTSGSDQRKVEDIGIWLLRLNQSERISNQFDSGDPDDFEIEVERQNEIFNKYRYSENSASVGASVMEMK